ncbi:MAG: iron uptake porin [Microcystaceae cyanobacterium]
MQLSQSSLGTIMSLGLISGNVLSSTFPVLGQTFNHLDIPNNSMVQVTNVNQLRDVSPDDWAYEALRSLVERYGCIVGYPDQTYRGNRGLTRWEFAAGLNACLNTIERLFQENMTVLQEDLDILKRLAEEFQAELTALGISVDNSESRTAWLENNQFSTTTKLKGEMVFSLTNAFGDKRANSEQDLETQTVLDNRVRLNLNTSFTGKDLLKVRLDSINAERFGPRVTGTQMTRLPFDLDNDNNIEVGRLFYRFPVGQKLRITVDATGGRYNANLPNYSRFFFNPLKGSISRFGRHNPIYYQGILGAGVSGTYKFNKTINFSAGYLARRANEPEEGAGLFNGSYAAITQLGINPTDNINFGLTYVRAYYPVGEGFVSGATGSLLANRPFGSLPTSANHFGFQSSFQLAPQFNLSSWAGWSQAYAEGAGTGFSGVTVNDGDQANILNWAVTFAFLDVGKEGGIVGLVVGQPPKVTFNESEVEDPDSAWHLQAQYLYPVHNNFSLNPGVFLILNPENNSTSPAIFMGTIRGIFTF